MSEEEGQLERLEAAQDALKQLQQEYGLSDEQLLFLATDLVRQRESLTVPDASPLIDVASADSVAETTQLFDRNVSAEDELEYERIPNSLREIRRYIDGSVHTLKAFGSAKIDALTSEEYGSEGGVIFYEDSETQTRYALKFFRGSNTTQAQREIRWQVNVEGRYNDEALDSLSAGFPMASYLSGIHPSFLPLVSHGILSLRESGDWSMGTPNETTLEKFHMPSTERPQFPFVLTPYLNIAPVTEFGSHDAYHELGGLQHIEAALAKEQQAIFTDFRGKDTQQIKEVVQAAVDAITQQLATDHGIGLWDIEPYVNLKTGDIKILDVGMSIPLEQPSVDFLDHIARLYGYTPEQINKLVSANTHSFLLKNFRARSQNPLPTQAN